MANKVKIQFCGGAGSVTGSNFLIEIGGKKILVDCGLNQGTKVADDINWEDFIYEAKDIDILFVTHAHVDHLGRVPKLVSEGFVGEIYSTLPTYSLALPMLEDTAFILSHNHDYELSEIYSELNIKKALSLWKGFSYYQKVNISDELSFTFYNAGHILGSAMVLLEYMDRKFLFTGDLGNSPSPILPDTDTIKDIDYLVMESVYGDRNHESRDERKKLLKEVIEENYKRKGTLLIPTFSLERSQELLFELNDMVENKQIPFMPIFFDSPLGIKLTEIFKQYKGYLNEHAQKAMVHDKYIFDFPGLRSTLKTEESKMITKIADPKVIIAGSGMSSGGRIVHHEREYLPNKNNMILLTGYQSAGTLGRLIQEGVKTVRIGGEDVRVRARVVNIAGYSGHKDSDALIEFVSHMAKGLKKVFVVMGEPKSSMFLAQKLRDNLGLDASTPEIGDSVIIEI